jgi:hypothetical protein
VLPPAVRGNGGVVGRIIALWQAGLESSRDMAWSVAPKSFLP